MHLSQENDEEAADEEELDIPAPEVSEAAPPSEMEPAGALGRTHFTFIRTDASLIWTDC